MDITAADQCRHLLRGARRRRALARRRRAPNGSDQRHEECVNRGAPVDDTPRGNLLILLCHRPLGTVMGVPVASKTKGSTVHKRSTPLSAAHALGSGVFSRFVPLIGSCSQFGLILHPHYVAVPFPPIFASSCRNSFVQIHGAQLCSRQNLEPPLTPQK